MDQFSETSLLFRYSTITYEYDLNLVGAQFFDMLLYMTIILK